MQIKCLGTNEIFYVRKDVNPHRIFFFTPTWPPFYCFVHKKGRRGVVWKLTKRFHVAVRLFSNRSQMTSKCGKNKEVTHEPQAIQWSEKKKTDTYTCLVPFDCSTICASLGIFRSQTLCFVSGSFFFFIDLYTVSSKSLSTSFLAQSRIMAKTFCKTSSLSYRWHTMATVVKISCSLGILKL